MLKKLYALFEITRPINCLFTGLVVFISGLLALENWIHFPYGLLWASLSAALIAAWGNVINDAHDVDIDKINKPHRPIPSGRLTIHGAVFWGYILAVAGLYIGFDLGFSQGFIALTVTLILWSYSLWWKRLPLIGNLAIALCSGLAFIYGALTVSNLTIGIMPAIFAFLIHLSREIIKDIEDLEGDQALGAKTLPLSLGVGKSLNAAVMVLILLIILTPLPFILDLLGNIYLAAVIALVDAPLIALIVYLKGEPEKSKMKKASAILKLIMAAGLVSLFLGKID